jgi:sortase A
MILLDAKLYQARETRQFQQQMKDFKPAITSKGRVQDVSVHSSTEKTLGEIELTRIGVAAMILEGTDARTLRRAVGHIPGTAFPGQSGNVAIAGHRDTFFRALRNVRLDDEITLTTLDGSYRYRVDSIKVVGPEDTKVLDYSSEDILTLVTCYPFYFVGPAPRRFIVRAQRISQ